MAKRLAKGVAKPIRGRISRAHLVPRPSSRISSASKSVACAKRGRLAQAGSDAGSKGRGVAAGTSSKGAAVTKEAVPLAMSLPPASSDVSKTPTRPPLRKISVRISNGAIGAGRISRTEPPSAKPIPCSRASRSISATTRPETAPPWSPPKGPPASACGSQCRPSCVKRGSMSAAATFMGRLAGSEEREGSDLDAFARRRVGRGRWILEGGVNGESGAAVPRGIEAFDEEHFVALHAREVVPAMTRIVGRNIYLADPIGIAPLRAYEVALLDAARIANRERPGEHRPLDRPPQIDLDVAPLAPRFRLGGREEIAHALGRRGFGVVIVHAIGRLSYLPRHLPRQRGIAQRVVEDHDFGRAGRLDHEALDLWVVDALDLGVVMKIDDTGGTAFEQEALAVQRHLRQQRPPIANRQLARRDLDRGLRHAGRRFAGIGEGRVDARREVVERRLDLIGRRCDLRSHGFPPGQTGSHSGERSRPPERLAA